MAGLLAWEQATEVDPDLANRYQPLAAEWNSTGVTFSYDARTTVP